VQENERAAHLEITDVMARCAMAGDARIADAYAKCFTEDGVLQVGAESIRGREALRTYMGVRKAVTDSMTSPPSFVSHHLTSCRIDLTSETTAKARAYWMVITAVGVDHSGYYDDEFRRTGENWLISFRRPRTLWISSLSIVASRPSRDVT
jgi:hypothetical protein